MKKSVMFALCGVVSLWATASFAGDDVGTKKFNAKCGSCHGKDGKGKTKKGDQMGIGDMTTADWQKKFTDDKIKETLQKGVKREKDGKKQEMDAFTSEDLKDEEVAAIIKHIRELGGAK